MKNSFLFLIFSALISCDQTQKLTPTEKRIIGSWHYDDVDFWPTWGVKEDLTTDFDQLVFTFHDDFTVTMADAGINESWTGVWEVNTITVSASDGSVNSTEELIASLSNDVSGEVIQLVWENLGVTNSRIISNHDTKEGYFSYRLKRN